MHITGQLNGSLEFWRCQLLLHAHCVTLLNLVHLSLGFYVLAAFKNTSTHPHLPEILNSSTGNIFKTSSGISHASPRQIHQLALRVSVPSTLKMNWYWQHVNLGDTVGGWLNMVSENICTHLGYKFYSAHEAIHHDSVEVLSNCCLTFPTKQMHGNSFFFSTSRLLLCYAILLCSLSSCIRPLVW